jgi:hypothetical protein
METVGLADAIPFAATLDIAVEEVAPTHSSPSPRWTGCNRPPTNSSSRASPTGSARNPARKAGPSDFVGLTSSPLVGHHHHTARDRKQPVPYS